MLKEGVFSEEARSDLRAPHRQRARLRARSPCRRPRHGELGPAAHRRARPRHARLAPWRGVDPVAVAARIVLALEALPAREVDVRKPSVVSIASIHGGVRYNVIPDEVELLGTDPHARSRAAGGPPRAHRAHRDQARRERRARARRSRSDERNPITRNDAGARRAPAADACARGEPRTRPAAHLRRGLRLLREGGARHVLLARRARPEGPGRRDRADPFAALPRGRSARSASACAPSRSWWWTTPRAAARRGRR